MTLNSYIVTIRVEKSKKDSILEKIKKQFPNSKTKLVRDYKDSSLLLFQNKSNKSANSIEAELVEIDGVKSADITSERKGISRLRPSYSTFLIIGLAISWIYFSYAAFTNDDFINQLTNSQTLVIEITIALAIVYWLFRYDKKWQQDVADVLLDVDVIANQIKEYVKDIQKSEK